MDFGGLDRVALSNSLLFTLSRMKLNIDHVTVCGSDLEQMRRGFAEVGLRTSYGGRHANGVTHMDLLTFPDGSYIELIAPLASLSGATGMTSGWARLMKGNVGAGAWAVRAERIRDETARLRAAGIEVDGPEAGSRLRPDGRKIEWETALLGTGAAGSVLPFLIEDKTPREWRVPAPGESRGIEGVAGVVIAVRDLAATVALFRRAFGCAEPSVEEDSEFGAMLGKFPEIPVILAVPLSANSWLAERIERFGECPTAFLLKGLSSGRGGFAWGHRSRWREKEIAWLDVERLGGTRIGVME
jgi:hypothetical protein